MSGPENTHDLVLKGHALDTEYFVRRGVRKGFQIMSLVAPTVYAGFALSRYGRSHFTITRVLRASYIGGATGATAGGAFEYVRSAYSNPEIVRTRRMQAAYDTSSIRTDDYSTIGAVVFAVLVPATFWKQASVIDLVLGGGAIGSAGGVLAHHAKYISGDHPPQTPFPEQNTST